VAGDCQRAQAGWIFIGFRGYPCRAKEKRTDSVGPLSILSRFCPIKCRRCDAIDLRAQTELLLLRLLLRHGLFSIVLREAKAVPTDAGINTRSDPTLQSKSSKKRLFFRILMDIQVFMKTGSR
jgi:hypothetical protein